MAKLEVPEGLWMRCKGCSKMVFRKALEEALHVCPECGLHYRVNARTRIEQLIDPGSFEEVNANLVSTDPLRWQDEKSYRKRLDDNREKAGTAEAVVTGKAYIKGRAVI